MKIVLIANSSSGLYNFRRDLILRMKSDNHEITAITPLENRVEQLRELGIKLIETYIDRRGLNPLHDLSLFIQYLAILKNEKPNQVITYTIKPNIYGGIACRVLSIPYAANITGLGTAFEKNGMLRNFVTILNKIALKKAKVVFFENSEILDLFVDEKIIRKDQAALVNGAGVNLYHYSYKPYPKGKEVRFLFMGRIMKEKGVDELFGAMTRLRSEGYACSIDILGSFEEEYDAKIKQYEKEGWLHYHGYQNDVRPFIENAHCFVLPSYHEGMANTNLESAAMGRPVITSNIPGCKEAVLNGVSGLLCEPKDVDSLYSAMKKMVMLSREDREEMGRQGRKHMEIVFDKTIVVENTMKRLFN